MLEGKELCIAVVDKLGLTTDPSGYVDNWIPDDEDIKEYLKDRAADILFQEGMAERLDEQVKMETLKGHEPEWLEFLVSHWWRTITPEKILNVWLELDA